MVKTMQASSRKENVDWIANIKNYVLEAQNFSDEKFLLMEKADEDRIPKKVMRMFMCQYLLSKTYKDMFDENKILSDETKQKILQAAEKFNAETK